MGIESSEVRISCPGSPIVIDLYIIDNVQLFYQFICLSMLYLLVYSCFMYWFHLF